MRIAMAPMSHSMLPVPGCGVARDEPVPAAAGRDPGLSTGGVRVPLPVVGAVIFGGMRLLDLAVAAFLLGHGKFLRVRHWSLVQWITSWDAKPYLTLAAHGYGSRLGLGPLPRGTLYPWFPGYPGAIRALAWLPGLSLGAAGFIVTICAGLAAAWGLTRLTLMLTADHRVSLLLVALWAAAPGSAVFTMLYPEALYCALAIWALIALASRRWLTAAALAIVAGTVQSEAVALIAAVTTAALCSLIPAIRGRQPAARWWRPLAALVLAPLGMLGYLAFVAARVHRPDGWFWIESAAWYQSFDWGYGIVHNLGRVILGWTTLAETLLVLIAALAIVLTAWSLTQDLPPFLHIYTLAAVALALGASETWFSCKLRFLLPAALVALPAARALARLRTPVLIPVIATLAISTAWLGLYLSVIAKLPP